MYSPKLTKPKKKRIQKELLDRQKEAVTKKEEESIQANLVAVENAHSRRPRCANFGELEQMDASPYEWFGAEKTTLHIAVDDASGAITGAWFDKEETLSGYYHVLHRILTDYGIPYRFFTDRRTVFTYKKKASPRIEEDTFTQFSYACKQLGIDMKASSVPQAKGRVERMFETLQSRLPVELRLKGVTTLDEANEFLNSYIKEFNARFALPVHSINSVFEKQPEAEKINLILAVLTERCVDSGHCIRFRQKYYRMVDRAGLQVHYLKGTKVMVVQAFDGRLYCTVNDRHVYELEEIPLHEEKSREFSPDYQKPALRKRNIPAMNHPWRSRSFWKYVHAQKQHWDDPVIETEWR